MVKYVLEYVNFVLLYSRPIMNPILISNAQKIPTRRVTFNSNMR